MNRVRRVRNARLHGSATATALFSASATWQRPTLSAAGVETWGTVSSSLACRILGNTIGSSANPLDLFAQAGDVRIAMPYATAIKVGDRLIIDGRTYNITDVEHMPTYGVQRIATARLSVPYGEGSA